MSILEEAVMLPTREELDAWLEANCGNGMPHGEATDTSSMLHGLAYILRQIEGTDRYMVNIGQTTSATSALRLALDRFAVEALSGIPATGSGETAAITVEAFRKIIENNMIGGTDDFPAINADGLIGELLELLTSPANPAETQAGEVGK